MTAPVQPRVLVSGQPVAIATNIINVGPGCPFQIPVGVGTKPQPCITVKWVNLSSRVAVMGQPVLLQVSPGPGAGVCQSAEQIPQGPPVVSAVQPRVFAI
ncbi:hypothetical protein EDC63_106106 [Sulfurirhabdus autotrophica]|uniref:Uncharacterized protein n=1 Tax=Sulfurirhabdus autotrophica TaxID=1706046 RepID=A0A4R3Y3G7_9PROT|nr:hypothetical protein EDC63_106106 [Sulfurirhabdus autotrophica]